MKMQGSLGALALCMVSIKKQVSLVGPGLISGINQNHVSLCVLTIIVVFINVRYLR